jgi:hypothetical protein
VGSGPWRIGAELNRQLSTSLLEAVLGDRFEQLLAEAATSTWTRRLQLGGSEAWVR